MTDHEARAREIVCIPGFCGCADDLADGMSEEEASGHTDDCLRLQVAISQALREAEEAAETRWMLAQKALNQIDDGFEYRYGDEKSRAFVHKVLADYTASVRGEKDNG